jgi:hypothetical protein
MEKLAILPGILAQKLKKIEKTEKIISLQKSHAEQKSDDTVSIEMDDL